MNKVNNVNKVKNVKEKQLKKTSEENFFISGIKYLFLGYLVTFVMIIGYAALITYTQMTDKYIMFVILITTIVSTTFIGNRFAKKAENKGMLWGALGGLLYGVVFVLLGYLSQEQYLISNRSVFVMVFSLIAGGIGGIVGINSKK